jgi:hypothetical protein
MSGRRWLLTTCKGKIEHEGHEGYKGYKGEAKKLIAVSFTLLH